MIEIPSRLENNTFKLIDLEKKLKPVGYVIGGGWEYDHGYFDYKMADNGSYLFVRLPFEAVDGEELDVKGVHVTLGRPFLLAHKYQRGLDDNVHDPNPLLNQFSEPQDPDAEFPQEWVQTGREYVSELEQIILNNMEISPRN
ncbi:YugN-like family protein [Salipaludibacillus sp. CUR1]|uniref:YugN-like family protein n=1 Tax=Salipaludibacillus aurantiacus TaxID=1601833 RepID=A0A1H9WI60_9BACI|nr:MULTISPECIES: YugN-like family protein [Salipaludibacillus]MCE7792292.1 YugN-like family protein [Salipaludibacillus sp. CUR1]SES33580.1 YugN-like family protein [Salipaludibacillus aurantiacus]